jgi:hypothetical protein
MAMIYALAALTLSAVNAEDSSVGCFVQPPALSTGFITNGETTVSLEDTTAAANFLSDQREDVKVLVRELVEHLTPSRGSAAKYDYSKFSSLLGSEFPLMQRGWVFQERMLPQRVLYFGDVDVLWECSELSSCYCGFWATNSYESPHGGRSKKGYSDTLQRSLQLDDYALVSWWRTALSSYTRMNLTYPSDRLPAIAGVARQISRYMSSPRYLAGLWDAHLVSDLLWHETEKTWGDQPDNNYVPSLMPAKVSFPSWSWVSAPGRIRYGIGQCMDDGGALGISEFSPRILDAKCTPVSNHSPGHEFLGVKGGAIKLVGQLISKVLLVDPDDAQRAGVVPVDAHSEVVAADFLKVNLDSGLGSEPAEWPKSIQHLGRSLRQYPHNVWMLRMGCWVREPHYSNDSWEHFLLLGSANETEGEYIRIGIGWYGKDRTPSPFSNTQGTASITIV